MIPPPLPSAPGSTGDARADVTAPGDSAPSTGDGAPADAHSTHGGHGHRYDGIQEFDNPMPRWWVALFWLTIAFTPLYIAAVHVFGWLPTYDRHLAAQTDDLTAVREAYAAANPAFATDPATLATYAANADNAAAGAATYAALCVACHGDKGQGLIGPNLTDEHWLHGATPEAVYAVLTKGVVEKGMPAWDAALSDEERGQLLAFITSIYDTHPPGAKEPQGVEVEEVGEGRASDD